MGITRQAKNYSVKVTQTYNSITGKKLYKYADKVTIDATEGDIQLASGKKVVSSGGC